MATEVRYQCQKCHRRGLNPRECQACGHMVLHEVPVLMTGQLVDEEEKFQALEKLARWNASVEGNKP